MKPLIVNGWKLYAHPLFIQQVAALTKQVQQLEAKDPQGYHKKSATKRLAAIVKLALQDIPQTPADPQYRQGNTLGSTHRHWHRAKFYQQYRLFFRYDQASQIIIYAWVNDTDTKRAYESDQDAYRVFSKMLKKGHPPNTWDELKAEVMQTSENHLRSLLGEN